MKVFALAPIFIGLASAAPATVVVREDVPEQRAVLRNELIDGDACPGSILIFARGTLELGNMGIFVGPPLAYGLEAALGAENIWIQGVGGQYTATIGGNLAPDGSTSEAIAEMIGLLELANSKCPDAKIVTGGYSQGAALAAAAIRDVDASIRDKIVGTALFGYTKNQQNNGQVINYPSDRLAVYCNEGDSVCEITSNIVPPHFDYGHAASVEAPQFLAGKINA